ncbi:serum paraoxonase/arylesterase-like protein [Bisporella sp. PMI_857]|nr:serum paraoxonase/arylesterase-like protein [Bisporella sp. PMI_857]
MGAKPFVFGAVVILSGILWQNFLHDFVFYAIGLGRTIQRIEEFPYTCRRLRHPLLESCEDMALDSEGRTLYAACSTSISRQSWSPGGTKYNSSGRALADHVSVLKIDEPGEDGLFGLHKLDITERYKSATGGREIDVHGLDIEALENGLLRLWMINHRPPIDESGQPLDATKLGANSTIEAFDLRRDSSQLDHVKTFHDDAIQTPNSVSATGDGGFMFTNDHGNYKTGALRELSFVYCPGTLGYCASNGTCGIAYPKGNFPNGMTKDKDGLYYVAQSTKFRIEVYSRQDNGSLLKIDEIIIGMGLDNLSIDENGDIFVAGFPDPICLIKAISDPVNVDCAASIFRIRKSIGERGELRYEVTKALEDAEAKYLPVSTVAVHDAKADKFFLGGFTSPYITVCEKRK